MARRNRCAFSRRATPLPYQGITSGVYTVRLGCGRSAPRAAERTLLSARTTSCRLSRGVRQPSELIQMTRNAPSSCWTRYCAVLG